MRWRKPTERNDGVDIGNAEEQHRDNSQDGLGAELSRIDKDSAVVEYECCILVRC